MRKFLMLILCLFLASTLVVSVSCGKKEEVPPAPVEEVAPPEKAPPELSNEELLDAAKKGDIDTVQALLDKGADVNARDKSGVTVLMHAAFQGNSEVVKALLDKGADVNAKNNEGITALTTAGKGGHTNIVKLLKQAGAKE